MMDPHEPQEELFDPQRPGKARTIYIVVVMLVVISLLVGMAGVAVWDRLF